VLYPLSYGRMSWTGSR